jgi:hypothetical protein
VDEEILVLHLTSKEDKKKKLGLFNRILYIWRILPYTFFF